MNAGKKSLVVLVRCHWLVCAVPARSVTRLVLPDEVSVSGASSPLLVTSGGASWAGWDLGELFELGSEHAAWLLLQLADDSAPLNIALRTGTCLRVQELLAPFELPSNLFRARRPAFSGAFPVSEVAGELGTDHGVLGVLIDPTRLLRPGELDASRQLLAAAPDAARP